MCGMAHEGAARTLFVTGATGFIGRRVMSLLRRAGDRPVRCLVREGRAFESGGAVQVVRGSLEHPESYAQALAGVNTVLHLAAKTGPGRRTDHFRTNADGTASLVRACREAGVQWFVHLSSIAVTYQNKTAYHYAESKERAEQIVRSSGMRWVIVRPTFVFGDGSRIETSLARLAALPVVPIFGDGRARVQPIHVDDVAAYLVSALDDPSLDHRDVNLGGPETVSFEDLVRRIRRATRGDSGRVIHLPGRATMRALAFVERWIGPVLPIGAGQIAACLNDSVATPEPRAAVDQIGRAHV